MGRSGRGRRGGLQQQGTEPDYRFSLANERTLLAYLRTALALMAAGVALMQLSDHPIDVGTGAVLVLVGVAVSLLSYSRWWRVEAALRNAQPLPLSRLPAAVGLVLALAGLCLLIARLVHA